MCTIEFKSGRDPLKFMVDYLSTHFRDLDDMSVFCTGQKIEADYSLMQCPCFCQPGYGSVMPIIIIIGLAYVITHVFLYVARQEEKK